MGEHDSGHVLGPDDDGGLDVEAMFWAQRAVLPRGVYENTDDDRSPQDLNKTVKDALADTALDSSQLL